MEVTCFSLASRFVGVKEVAGTASNSLILAMLRLDEPWPQGDEVPWCSAFCNFICWLLRVPRSKSLAARSWLDIGTPVSVETAQIGNDIVILSRDQGGHVGFYAGHNLHHVILLGGNQSDKVGLAEFDRGRVLGVRRLVTP